MKFNFIIIPIIIAATAYIGGRYTKKGLMGWYQDLAKPQWTPSGATIGEIWIFLYLLTGFAVMWFWNVPIFGVMHYVVGAILLVNAYMNATWNKIFFVQHNFAKAYKWMIIMNVTSVVAAILMGFLSVISALLMLPYIIWVGVATKLTKDIWTLNKNF